LKAAHSTGSARLQPFDLWKNPSGLSEALGDLLRGLPSHNEFAVTMTGELCDCFATKREGVLAILEAVEQVAGGVPIRIWQTDGRLVGLDAARLNPLLAASSNWRALAVFVGRFAPTGPAVLIDVGSTTTDIIPLQDGRPVPRGRTDLERLASGELVYTGVRRTPLCALLGPTCAAELFATTLDVYLLLGPFEEDDTDRQTADGRPATMAHAHARLARMLCADPETYPVAETRRLALRARRRQIELIRRGIEQVAANPDRPITAILAGSGSFLALLALDGCPGFHAEPILLDELLKPELSEAACAYALAVLAAEANDVHHK
jgi:probable H4MPT-linked C1 transfer pathway protein